MARRRLPALRIGAHVRLRRVWWLPNRLALRADTGQITDRGPEPDIWVVRLDQPAVWIWPDGTTRRNAAGAGPPPEDYIYTITERAECIEILLP